MKINCRAVVFDWDGTLVNSLPLKIRNAGRVFQKILQLDAKSVESAYRKYSGIPRHQLFTAIARDVGKTSINDHVYSELSTAFSDLNRHTVQSEHIFPDALPALLELKSLGFQLFVSSSAVPDDVISAAHQTRLAELFAEVLGSKGTFTKGKVHVTYICDKYSLNLADICLVGDELADISYARDAGVKAVGRVGTLTEDEMRDCNPDVIISNLYQIIEILELYNP